MVSKRRAFTDEGKDQAVGFVLEGADLRQQGLHEFAIQRRKIDRSPKMVTSRRRS